MGLTPSYVAILQQQWMRDDYSTITNTYPDHEDLQGPAGINIPEVMTNFIPRGGTLFTTEEQMLPILRADAAAKGTHFRTTGWLEAGLIPPDTLDRFPYAEHPYNIALVLKLAEELEIESDFALKEMADRVVADLGVLKASPVATLDQRRMEFVNGMSANERFGCMGNWERMEFATQNPYEEPGVWLVTVVNNRADRVPRSRVFADILVKDISADRHFLIGTNLDGLQSYIREAWAEHSREVTLFPASINATPSEVLERTAARMRISYREEHLRDRISTMLAGCDAAALAHELSGMWNDPEHIRQILGPELDEPIHDAMLSIIESMIADYTEYTTLAEKVAAGVQDPALDEEFQQQVWKWFQRKLVVIEDAHASGHQVINTILRESPPGLHTRLMGLQNIKGTGLDFVYRWQAWETCYHACEALKSLDPAVAERGLRQLAAFQDYNALCLEHVRETIEAVKPTAVAQSESFQAELALVLSNLENSARALNVHLQDSAKRGGSTLSHLLTYVEAFLDAGDAVKRRKAANRIYDDLVTARISHARAASELQALNKRQKGGWLQHRIENILRFKRK
jgi:poly-gamma-glutamate synthase PgsB/CapB